MLDRFLDIDDKLADLEGRLSDPALINNQQEYQKVVKEHAHLSRLAELLGSYRDYKREFQAVPGTYYLSKGWLESGSHPLVEYEEYVPRFGAEEAMWLMDQQYQHYERLVLVAHSQADLETYRPQAQEVARFCERWGMRYEEILGSDRYVRRLVELVRETVEGKTAVMDLYDGDFLIIPAGGEIQQEQFMR